MTNLRNIYKAEAGYYEKNRRYADGFAELGCAPLGAYAYYLGRGTVENVDGKVYPLPKDVQTWADKAGFQAVAVSNMDEDNELDVWTVNETGRVSHMFNDFTRPGIKDYPGALRQVFKKRPGS